jgi:hypothetical protein
MSGRSSWRAATASRQWCCWKAYWKIIIESILSRNQFEESKFFCWILRCGRIVYPLYSLFAVVFVPSGGIISSLVVFCVPPSSTGTESRSRWTTNPPKLHLAGNCMQLYATYGSIPHTIIRRLSTLLLIKQGKWRLPSSFVICSAGKITISSQYSCSSEQHAHYTFALTMPSQAKRLKVGSACRRCRRQKLKVSLVFHFQSILANLVSATLNAHVRCVSVLGSTAKQQTSGE